MPARPLSTVLQELDAYVVDPTVRDTWLGLEGLLAEVFTHDQTSSAARALLRLFERYPRHDGHGVLWGVIHGLEQAGGYEHALIESVQRCPTDLGVTMLRRLHKSGATHIGDVDVAALIAWATARAPEIDGTL